MSSRRRHSQRHRRSGIAGLFAADARRARLGKLRRKRKADRQPPFRCPRCTYDTMAFKNKPCPECGLIQKPEWRTLPPRAGRGDRLRAIRATSVNTVAGIPWCAFCVLVGGLMVSDWATGVSNALMTGVAPPGWLLSIGLLLIGVGLLFLILIFILFACVVRFRNWIIYGPRTLKRGLFWANLVMATPLATLVVTFIVLANLMPDA